MDELIKKAKAEDNDREASFTVYSQAENATTAYDDEDTADVNAGRPVKRAKQAGAKFDFSNVSNFITNVNFMNALFSEARCYTDEGSTVLPSRTTSPVRDGTASNPLPVDVLGREEATKVFHNHK